MREILREHGVDLRLDLADETDAEYEAEAARTLDFSDEVATDDGTTSSE